MTEVTERERLARTLFIASDDFAYADRMAKAWDAPGPHGRARWYRYADAVLAAGFRAQAADAVTTVEELDALPLNSVILDEGGLARQAWSSIGRRNWWSEVGDDGEESSGDLIEHVLACGVEAKFTVLYRPVESEEGAEQ